MGILYYFWYYLGYIEDESDKPIMCINSFAPIGSRGINYVMKRIYFDDDEDEEDYVAEAEAEAYINRFYR